MSGKNRQRRRLRNPALVAQFAGRLRQAVGARAVKQRDLAERIGGLTPQSVSRLLSGELQALPIDVLVRLAAWADVAGVSLRWLFASLGPMDKRPIGDAESSACGVLQLDVARLVLGLAARANVDLSDLVGQISAVVNVPEWGFITVPLSEALARIEQQLPAEGPAGPARAPAGPIAQVPRPRRGYRTVPPEALPADWQAKYVPVIGRVAAGEGLDLSEATEYPPAWAGEFLVCASAPPSSVAVRVAGSSMEPTYRDGDMVIVDPGQPAESGEVCCVIVDRNGMQEARLKRLRLTSRHAILESLNDTTSPERIPRRDLIRAYRVVEHLPLLLEGTWQDLRTGGAS